MNQSVTLVDYGVGNLLSVRRALEKCGAIVRQTSSPDDIARADRLVLPGVGAFGDCMSELRKRDLMDPVIAFASTGRPLLGICVGMQILMTAGEEFGWHGGLGLIEGTVSQIPACSSAGPRYKVPHIGWSELHPPPAAGCDAWNNTILRNINPGASAYFVHSYTAAPVQEKSRLADCNYHGHRVSAVVSQGNVFGTQFHPEKSGSTGLLVLSAFVQM
jgi:glutamine amidotransferase